MGRIDDALKTLEGIPNGTERALQLAGLISTLFKINGVVLVATRHLAFHSYADTQYDNPEIELATFSGMLKPRTILEIMRNQLYAKGSTYHWSVGGIPVRFHDSANIVHRDLCRDFTTRHGVVKLVPVEEITADYILAAVYPASDVASHVRAHRLLFNGVTEVFEMNWPVLHTLCHRPDYRVGEELAQMRMEAKQDADAQGKSRDHVGDTTRLPSAAQLFGEEKSTAATATIEEVPERRKESSSFDDRELAG
jgi:hypothetical protein